MNIKKKELMDDGAELDRIFQRYRQACPDVEPSVNFMPTLWQKIEARHSFPFVFRKWGRSVVTASAALCLLLLALNLAVPSQTSVSYPDALITAASAEQMYYTETLASAPLPEGVPPSPLR
jgi:hypothetical protein